MDATTNPQDLLGKTIYGSDGEKLGTAGQVFVDDQTGRPEWVTVKTGLFGTKETFVPIREVSSQGADFAVPYDKERVKGAPNVEVDQGHLSEDQEDELYRYYGLSATSGVSDTAGIGTAAASGRTDTAGSEFPATGGGMQTGAGVPPTAQVDTDRDATAEGTVGYDTSGPTTDDAMTRSEERVNVGTERVEAGRARLRKYVTTENVTQTVPVEREHVVVEREPITDANRDEALSGPDLSEEEHEVVLSEERPVVNKETVPVERVRLDKETETGQETVEQEVRQEQIEVEDGRDR